MPRLDLIPEDVTTGRPGKPGTCPIARSIVRAGYIKPRVTGASIRFTDPETASATPGPAPRARAASCGSLTRPD